MKAIVTLICTLALIASSNLFTSSYQNWPERILEQMSLREKIGQLFMVAFFPDKDNVEEIEYLIEDYHIGGVMFMTGDSKQQIALTNHFQFSSLYPLLIGQDNEWGLSMRLSDALRFPRNMTLGAIQNNNLIYELGKEIGKECRLVGVRINFSPVVDINSNPSNPVISDRSFGENSEQVAKKAYEMMRGLQEKNIIACAKHWPGHGDTHQDSHLLLPTIDKNFEELQKCEWYPFQYLIDKGIRSIMTAHLYLPALENNTICPASLSENIIQNILVRQFGFNELIISDALNGMKALTDNYDPGEAELKALLAGTDILLFPRSIPKACQKIMCAVQDGVLSEKQLDQHVLKILKSKEWVGLHLNRDVQPNPNLHSENAIALKKNLYSQAITLVQNKDHLLPLKKNKKIAYLQIGNEVVTNRTIETNIKEISSFDKIPSAFFETLNHVKKMNAFFLTKECSDEEITQTLEQLNNYEVVILGLYEMNKYEKKNFGISEQSFQIIEKINQAKPHVILTIFGNPYSLKFFGSEQAIILAYENDPDAQIASANIIFGQNNPSGKLPVTASPHFPAGKGFDF